MNTRHFRRGAGLDVMAQSPSAVLIGAVVGVIIALSWSQLNDWVDRTYDQILPVASGTVSGVERGIDDVVFKLRVKRHRDCRYGPPPHAFIMLASGDLAAARVERIDGVPPGISYPSGATYYAGTWRIWPVVGATRAKMVARYDCGGRISHSVIADIQL